MELISSIPTVLLFAGCQLLPGYYQLNSNEFGEHGRAKHRKPTDIFIMFIYIGAFLAKSYVRASVSVSVCVLIFLSFTFAFSFSHV